MNDKRFEIAPPDRDGRRCVAEWLEITREGERHVLEYFREHPPASEAAPQPPDPAQDLAPPSDAVTRDVVKKANGDFNEALNRYVVPNGETFDPREAVKYAVTATLRTFAEALREEMQKIDFQTCYNLKSAAVLDRAISNLLPEVPRA